MKCILGIDTSNYTTSACLIDAQSGKLISSAKKLLPVKSGEIGIRQSDAVFHHTARLPEILNQVYDNRDCQTVAVSVSEKPCSDEGSYMPCFLAGVNAASAVATALSVPLFKTTHQTGHILACLYGCDKIDYINREFICYHVSGGTTQALLVKPCKDLYSVECVARSLDLKAGQAIDRIGSTLGFDFPAGMHLDEVSRKSDKSFNKKASFKGNDFSLSGLENLAYKMIEEGNSKEDVAKFTIDYIGNTLEQSAKLLFSEYGEKPLFFAGGVMSNSLIKERFTKSLNAYFCPPELSSDNAVGTALYGYLNYGKFSFNG